MKKVLLTAIAGFIVYVGIIFMISQFVSYKYSVPHLIMLESEFSPGRKDGLQVYELTNNSNHLLVLEIQCENIINVPEIEVPELGFLEPYITTRFPVMIDATKVETERPVPPQCRITKWVKWK